MTKTSLTESDHQEIAGVIEIRHTKPMVSSLKIAEMFDRPHKSVLRVLRELCAMAAEGLRTDAETMESGGTKKGVSVRGRGRATEESAGVLAGKISWATYTDSRGKEYPIAWLEEREALIAMPFIGGRNAHQGQAKLVDAYLFYRDAYANPPRSDLIRAKRDASHILTDSILEWRTDQEKVTDAVHYMAEQKLCNWAVSGQFKKADEAAMSNEDLDLLRLIRERNAALIVSGIQYDERKTRLSQYAIRQRTKRIAAPEQQP